MSLEPSTPMQKDAISRCNRSDVCLPPPLRAASTARDPLPEPPRARDCRPPHVHRAALTSSRDAATSPLLEGEERYHRRRPNRGRKSARKRTDEKAGAGRRTGRGGKRGKGRRRATEARNRERDRKMQRHRERDYSVVDCRPESSGDRDRNGRTPLHRAVIEGASLELVRFLVERRPEALVEEDFDGFTPLHCAVANNAPLGVVRLLVEHRPESLEEKRKGFTPLYCAVTNYAPLEVVRFLVEQHPDAFVEEDMYEAHESMLQYASMSWWGGVRLVIDAHPAMVHSRLHLDRGLLPVLLSRMSKLPFIFEVLREQPNSLICEDTIV